MPNEPVLTSASLAGLIAAALSFARLMDWLPMTDDQFNQLMIVVGLALPIAFGVWARSRVTPLAEPKDADGALLMRSDGTPPLEVQRDMRG